MDLLQVNFTVSLHIKNELDRYYVESADQYMIALPADTTIRNLSERAWCAYVYSLAQCMEKRTWKVLPKTISSVVA